MPTPVPRAWDLIGRGEASEFLAPFGLADHVAELPLPCRAAWLPGNPSGAPAAPAAAGVCVLGAAQGTLVAGSATALRALAARWSGPQGGELAGLLDRYERPLARLRFADGETWDLTERVRVMGVVNVTPDSFSDGGRFDKPAGAVAHGARLLSEGADLLDIGGESTRPGAAPVDERTELRRLIPVVTALREMFARARISVDTRRAHVARAALLAGADMINDVSALSDPDMASVAAAAGAPVALMHMRGEPATMQTDTHYDDLVGEVLAHLAERAARATGAGIAGDRILLDPGLGFGKSLDGNELLLRQLRSLGSLGRPILVGASRKAFIGAATEVAAPAGRLAGSLAAAVLAAREGAVMVRVHDVAATREALAMAGRLRRAGFAEDAR